ncbi:Aspartic proteinase nepenthesin-2 [Triticum urartu]|uniref:Aspartic proteinase nepenthesin-2 n=1 Tax=Triticum urartu TaxID=4572 RepID=M8A390_TRIUA|nr:Aspartic proteinase nepenthesin-2 [Triticum urartu]
MAKASGGGSLSAPYQTSRQGPPGGGPQQPAEKPATRETDSRVLHPARLLLYPWGAKPKDGFSKKPRGEIPKRPSRWLLQEAKGGNTKKALKMATSDAARSGKPGVRQTVIIDTSSDITWVQCLPCPVPQCHLQKDPLYDPADSTTSIGFLSLGGPPVGLLPRFVLTPLIRNPRAPTFYIVRLEAIAVSGKRLAVPPAAFAAGAVMDSNAVITQLPAVAYAALRAAFRSFMGAYPRAAPVLNLDTCYDFTRSPKVTLPKVSLVFAGGATVPLDAASIMLGGCLAFAAIPGNGSLGFIGNIQQQNYEVLYDVGGGSVGFRRGAC